MATVISKRQALGQIAAFVAIPAALIVGIIALQSAPTSTSSAPAISAPPLSCKTDWTVCTDNSDMANNYSGWSSAKIDCKFAANDQAKYGTPKWPSWGSEFG